LKTSDNGRTIATATVKVCSICGLRNDLGPKANHCPGHSNLIPGLAQTREIYAVDYVPPLSALGRKKL
jgi:hypothetical protein